MKLTKKQEAEILKAYNDLWNAYLKGDMRTFASILDDNCYIIGSAAGEVFSNKKAAVKYYKSTAEQITGKAEFRNRKIKMMPVEKGFMVNEGSDFYLLIDDQWTFYGPARISSLFHKKNNKWKVIHQHGSFPDSKTEEGEQVNTDKIKAENIQLRDAVKRRTEELENKNRELEIESSLEKVRAQAMGMQKPEDLMNVCKVLFTELSLLGFSELRNAIIHTYNDEENYFIDYDYSDLTGGVITNIPYSNHPVIKRFLKQIRKSDEAFAEIIVKGKELKEWKTFRKRGGQPDDPGLDKTSALYYYFHSVGTGDIGISTFSSINEEKLQLLKRFRNVFDLAYKRYTDITKAETQVREAQIQLSLERVRARAMAMHHSDELSEVLSVLFDQFDILGICPSHATISLIDTEKHSFTFRMTGKAGKRVMAEQVISLDALNMWRDTVDQLRKSDSVNVYCNEYPKEILPKLWELCSEVIAAIPEKARPYPKDFPDGMFEAVGIYRLTGNIAYGTVSFCHYRKTTEEEKDIVGRFATEFGRLYQRFLDLQKAEEQAREAGIELSLERVRAKTMAMQKPSEFVDVINIIGEQFVHLDFDIEWANFGANGLEISKGIDIWNFAIIPGGPPISARVFIPYFDHPLFVNAVEELNNYLQTGNDFFILALSKEDKDRWLDHLFTKTVFKDVPGEYRAIQYAKPGYTTSNIALKDTWFSIGKFDPRPFTDEQHSILRRFAKAFGQAYTRFLDLQKAEAQAREAQIEAGLERVRSRAMAMQSSEQLRELIGTVFTELTKLDIVLTRCLIMIYDPRSNDSVWWMANSEAPTQPIGLKVQYHEYPSYLAYVNAWKQKELKWTYTLEGNTKKEWDDFLFVETELSHLPDFVIAGMKAPDRVYLNASFNSFGNLTLATLEPLSDEHFDIMLRFAKVFDLTYTRFNDLKQAEAQTREAQIELALERVRARTMAMHKSEELAETAQVLFQQLSELGGIPDRIAIGIADEVKAVVNFWTTDQQGSHLDHSFSARLDERTTIAKTYQAWKEQEKSLVVDLHGEELKEWIKFAREEMGIAVKDDQIKDRRVHSLAFFSHGWILATSHEPQSTETIQILERFASVFNLTYRRFLDLEKAEAQAKEAQIETALEKIRSRSLAMHKSDELQEVVNTVFERLKDLDIEVDSSNIAIFKEGTRDFDYWIASNTQKRSASFHMPYIDLSLTKDIIAARESGADFSATSYPFEVKNEWFDFAFKETDFKFLSEERKQFILNSPGITVGIAFSKHTGVQVNRYSSKLLTEGEAEILKRFSKVFEQAYIRFLDLEKAEAQAREAQIETSLERIRSRTMGMQKSNELRDVAALLSKELISLGIPQFASCGYVEIEEKNNRQLSWLTNPDGISLDAFYLPLTGEYIFNERYDAWKRKDIIFKQVVHAKELKKHLDFAYSEFGSHESENVGRNFFPDPTIFYNCNFSYGYLSLITGVMLNQAEELLLARFTRVFEQTYSRFLDLQKAEAQAREAQIEASLERVRASAMAMHRSDELSNVLAILFEQFDVLKIQPVDVHLDLFDLEKNTFSYRATGKEGKRVIAEQIVDLDSRPEWQALLQKWKNGKPNTVDFSYYPKEVIRELMAFFPDIWAAMPEDAIMSPEDFPDGIFDALGYCKFGYIGFHHHRKATEEEQRILIRFANEFERLYQRFLDLQKAEAQAKEAKIETALEKVRASAMAMHNSNDISSTTTIIFVELRKLGIQSIRCGIGLLSKKSPAAQVYAATTSPDSELATLRRTISMTDHPALQQQYESWLKQENYIQVLKQDELRSYYQLPFFYSSANYIPPENFEQSELGYYIPFSEGVFYAWTKKAYSDDEINILNRFKTIVDLTFRRYLDLQKAEAQARDAQIEASLERVRSKTMAMHNSQDVGETVATMFDQLVKLGVTTNRCGILIFSDTNNTEVWTAKSNQNGEAALIIGHLDVTIHPMLHGVRNAWKNKETFYSYELAGDDIKNYYNTINNYPDYPTRFNLDNLPSIEIHSDFFFPEGAVFAFTSVPITAEASQIFKRFAGVFGQTYRRYLDLQKAESQAREAQIEASLERVRSKTMAMHSSDDVTSATATMFTELERLGIENMRCGIAHYLEDHKMEVWSVSNLADGKVARGAGLLDTNSIPFWKLFYSTWQKKEDFLYYYMAGKEKEDYFKKINAVQNYLSQSIEELPDLNIQTYYFREGSVWAFSLKPHSEEDKQVMKRFASVFSLTFRRYQDLQKAEAQTREATIETSLEKVRGKAMAMHNSNDLIATASLVFTELRKLGISPMRCGVGMLNKENRKALLYTAIASEEGDSLSQIGWVLLDVNPVLKSIYDHWILSEEYFPVLKKEMLKAYYEHLKSGFVVPEEQTEYEHHGYFLPFSEGVFYGWSEKPFAESEIKILKRFASVIDLTFRRYIELQKSETNAREAVKQAALDRVRAEIASMRTINDLDRITPLIWNELTILGIPFIRCGVFIMDNEQELIHTFLSTPDGKAIAAFHLPYDTPGNLRHVVTNWQKNKKYIDHWDETEFIQFADILVKEGALVSSEQYLKTIPKGGFYLHFLPFLQGMLYVGNTDQLKEEEIELIQHVADAFSTAYARYEDFNKLEYAKQQVEKTLTDLKQAQTQLVQSEKMASLGEMTAGIAHEIQNPLNFVNNFSEVSKELLDEMKTELETGNTEDAKDIADDVIQNLEKINHHGKRADAIVKSMLQHSRSSSGKKEPADINGLADEYLRLAYHGLRAKDKTFNAKFETELDTSIGKINIISQDIGRVLVNLINNAFYAVSERKKQESNGYEPTVTVFTKKIDDKIEIKVKDNGNGIPQKVLDKIFQPFFTTKPTGQGTGLGLSLAYDIITKGHGGELKVETKEGEGSEFVIQLPMS